MGDHHKKVCRECDTVITQCRCPSKDKRIEYDLCNSCKKAVLEGLKKGAMEGRQ